MRKLLQKPQEIDRGMALFHRVLRFLVPTTLEIQKIAIRILVVAILFSQKSLVFALIVLVLMNPLASLDYPPRQLYRSGHFLRFHS